MKRLFNLKKDKPDERDYVYIDYNQHIDVIEFLIYSHIMETDTSRTPLPNTTREYQDYFLLLKKYIDERNKFIKD